MDGFANGVAELSRESASDTSVADIFRMEFGSEEALPTGEGFGAPPIDAFIRFDSYRRANWDGEGADAIGSKVIQKARATMETLAPHLGKGWATPGSSGSIGLLWDTRTARVQASIRPDRRVQVFAKRKSDGEKMEMVLTAEVGAAKIADHILSHLEPEVAESKRRVRSFSSSASFFSLRI